MRNGLISRWNRFDMASPLGTAMMFINLIAGMFLIAKVWVALPVVVFTAVVDLVIISGWPRSIAVLRKFFLVLPILILTGWINAFALTIGYVAQCGYIPWAVLPVVGLAIMGNLAVVRMRKGGLA